MPNTEEGQQGLVRGLNLTATTSLVIGTIIGTGVFMKASVMAQHVGTPVLVIVAWVVTGVLTLAGALTYAELGAMLPSAGGEYVYLRKAYGKAPAFLFGWMRFVVGSTGSIAILGVGFATFLAATQIFDLSAVWADRTFHLLGQEIHWQFGTKQLVAVGTILLFSAINCVGVVFGGRVQSLLTVLKILGIFVIVGGVFFFAHDAGWSNFKAPEGAVAWSGTKAFGAAMLASLWAYDGWNNMPMVAGEVENPGRNVPRALIFGTAAVIAIYCIANLAYFYALPFAEVVTSNSTAHRNALPVATKAAQTFAGEAGGRLVTVAFLLSAMGALNGSILTGARVPFAMARDGMFFRAAGQLTKGSRVPAASIMMQAVWASVLAISGTFDQLTDYVIFASWIFYGLTTSSVFVLRRKMPLAERPYKTLGYPVVPLVFVLVAVWLIYNTLQTSPVESAAGLVLIGLGLPLYFFYRWRRKTNPAPPTATEAATD
jgi:APA family basic amino acid/polyamine antiporter